MRKIKKGRDDMDFLKTLFEAGALTWEQFSEAAKKAGFEVVNAAGGAYVPKADLDTKQRELDTAKPRSGICARPRRRGTVRTPRSWRTTSRPFRPSTTPILRISSGMPRSNLRW